MQNPNVPYGSISSTELYNYLCIVCGSEQDVKIRRIFFKVLDRAFRFSSKWKVVNSGSKAEGLDLPGSDLDIMYINEIDLVNSNQCQVPTYLKYGLVLDTSKTPVGFAHIKLIKNFKNVSFPKYEYIDNDAVLTNNAYKHLGTRSIHSDVLNDVPFMRQFLTPTHGPCTSTFCESVDLLYCYKCTQWPTIASRWITRNREHDWPTSTLISNIIQEGVLLVPIGINCNSNKDNNLEWRISFSIAEKMLIHSFNHTQLLCYAMLKLVLKITSNTNRVIRKFFCSYFMKTVLFWIIEETECSIWTPNNLICCFQECVKRLGYLVQNNSFPNYFIPENNMFKQYWNLNDRKQVLEKLSMICSEGITFLLKWKTLSDVISEQAMANNVKKPFTMLPNMDKILYPLFQYLRRIPGRDPTYLYKPLHIMRLKVKSKLLRNLAFLWLTKIFGCLGKQYNYDSTKRNKEKYWDYKTVTSYLLLNTYSDAVTGWILLAYFYYINIEYRKTVCILNHVPSIYSTDKQMITGELRPHVEYDVLKQLGVTFYRRYKFACADLFYTVPQDNPQQLFLIMEPNAFFTYVHSFVSVPLSITYKMLIICHKHIGNEDEKRKTLQLWKTRIINTKCIIENLDGFFEYPNFKENENETVSDFLEFFLGSVPCYGTSSMSKLFNAGLRNIFPWLSQEYPDLDSNFIKNSIPQRPFLKRLLEMHPLYRVSKILEI